MFSLKAFSTALCLLVLGCRSYAGEWPNTMDICELLVNPGKYDGKIIALRGELKSTHHGFWLFRADCSGTLITDGYRWPTDVYLISPNSSQATHEVSFEEDPKALASLVSITRRLRPGQRVWATFSGMLEAHKDPHLAMYRDGDGKLRGAGFGHLSASPAQLIVKSVKDVVVK